MTLLIQSGAYKNKTIDIFTFYFSARLLDRRNMIIVPNDVTRHFHLCKYRMAKFSVPGQTYFC